MKLEKAIEIIADHIHYWKDQEPPDYHDALSLGSEALKVIQHYRKSSTFPYIKPLSGETEED